MKISINTSVKVIIKSLLLSGLLIGCQEFVEVDPPTSQITASIVFESDATAKAAMAGLYSRMMEDDQYFTSGSNSITTITGLSGDDFNNFNNSPTKISIFANALTGDETSSLWNTLYSTINQANAILEGVLSGKVSLPTKNQLEGEALFIRAFSHFQLVNLFGDIPIVTTTDYRINNQLTRNKVEEVYKQIVADLEKSQTLLTDSYSNADGEKIRPNKTAATAMLARAYLFIGDWTNTEIMATQVINNPLYALEDDLNRVFLANNSEAIWQLKPVFPGFNTFDGITYILISEPTEVTLSDELLNAFELSDQRLSDWVGNISINGNTFYYPFKYKVRAGSDISEYLTVLRLAEQFLIRAEARAHLSKLAEAREDINVIRNRAGLGTTVAVTLDELLLAIEQERRVELFCEWGHRWFDLKRTNRINTVLASSKLDWQDTDKRYPIPPSELSNNPNLLPQNPGY